MDRQTVNKAWEDPEDLLDRKKYADFLTKYLASKQEPFVLNLNAGWGMGKTYLLTHWQESIKDTHPTVYVNAWESDFSDDPLLAVMSAIYEQLKTHLPEEQQSIDGFMGRVKASGLFLKALAPIITKGLIHKALGEEAGEQAYDQFFVTDKSIANAAEKSMGHLLENHAEKEQSMEEFRKSLTTLITDITKRELTSPLFLFIDELDRCRPTYAIELLETVKHLFSAKGIVFIIATDSEQLQHSIRAVYGNNFDGGEYLRRFFDQEYKLPPPNYASYCKFITSDFIHSDKLNYAHFDSWNINSKLSEKPSNWNAQDSLSAFLAFYSKHFDLPLRSINQVAIRLDAILSSPDKIWDGPFLILLLVLEANRKGTVSWLREACDKGQVNHGNEFINRLITGGDKMNWFRGDNFRQDGSFQDEYAVSTIASMYCIAIQTIKRAHQNALHDYISDVSDLSSYTRHIIAWCRTNENEKFVNIEDYFDHIEMAGALS